MKFLGIPTCKDVFDKRHEREDLPLYTKLMHRLHIAMCSNCQKFLKVMNKVEVEMEQQLHNCSHHKVDDKKIKDIENKALELLNKSNSDSES